MYWIKIRNVKSGNEEVINFEDKETAKLYRDYHCKFDAWDKKEVWIAEEFLNPNYKKLITEEKEIELLNSKKEVTKKKFYKVSPTHLFVEDNLGLNTLQLFWDNLRKDRNQSLTNTDWTQLADSKLSNKFKQLYREYRDYLRDLPKQYNNTSIGHYRIMSFDEWVEWKYIKV